MEYQFQGLPFPSRSDHPPPVQDPLPLFVSYLSPLVELIGPGPHIRGLVLPSDWEPAFKYEEALPSPP